MHQQLETLWRKIKSKVEGLAGGPACTEEEEKHRGPGRPSRLRSLTEQEAISGQKLGLHAARAWALHVSAPVLLAGSQEEGRRGTQGAQVRSHRQGMARRTSVIDTGGRDSEEQQGEDCP